MEQYLKQFQELVNSGKDKSEAFKIILEQLGDDKWLQVTNQLLGYINHGG